MRVFGRRAHDMDVEVIGKKFAGSLYVPESQLEAMKMENNVAADIDGTVTEIWASAGQSVGAGEIILVIEATA